MGFWSAVNSIKKSVSKASSKLSSAVKIAGTNIKNSFSKESIMSFGKGFMKGGLVGGISSAVTTTVQKSMKELDKSGVFNPEYEYKQFGFPSKAEYEKALSFGVQDYQQWKQLVDQGIITGLENGTYQLDANGQIVQGATASTAPPTMSVSSSISSAPQTSGVSGGSSAIIAGLAIAKILKLF